MTKYKVFALTVISVFVIEFLLSFHHERRAQQAKDHERDTLLAVDKTNRFKTAVLKDSIRKLNDRIEFKNFLLSIK